MKTSQPDTLILVLTYRCNMKCDYCPVEKSNASMSWSVARRGLEGFLKFNRGTSKHIRLFGGEPLLEFPLIERIVDLIDESFSDPGVTMDVTTNVTLLDEGTIDFFRRHPYIELILSIDGTSETHEIHRKSEYEVSKIIEKHIKELTALPELTINKVVTPSTVASMYKDFLHIVSLGFSRINILPSYYLEWDSRSIEYLKIQLNGIVEAIALFNKNGKSIRIKNAEVEGDMPLFNTAVVVDVDGSLYPGNAFMHMALYPDRKDFQIGDAYEYSETGRFEYKNQDSLIRKALNPELMESAMGVDAVLSDFVSQYKRCVY